MTGMQKHEMDGKITLVMADGATVSIKPGKSMGKPECTIRNGRQSSILERWTMNHRPRNAK